MSSRVGLGKPDERQLKRVMNMEASFERVCKMLLDSPEVTESNLTNIIECATLEYREKLILSKYLVERKEVNDIALELELFTEGIKQILMYAVGRLIWQIKLMIINGDIVEPLDIYKCNPNMLFDPFDIQANEFYEFCKDKRLETVSDFLGLCKKSEFIEEFVTAVGVDSARQYLDMIKCKLSINIKL